MNYAWTAGLALLLALTGCASHRASSAFRTVIRPNCLTGPIILQKCDATADLLHCRGVVLKYRASCAEIQLNGTKREPKESLNTGAAQ